MKRRRKLEPEVIEKIRELRRKGIPVKKIAKELKVSVPAVYKHLKKKEGLIEKLKKKLGLHKKSNLG